MNTWILIVITTHWIAGGNSNASNFAFQEFTTQRQCYTIRDWINKEFKDNHATAQCIPNVKDTK